MGLEEKTILKVESAEKYKAKTAPTQSANTLFRFLQSYAGLYGMTESMQKQCGKWRGKPLKELNWRMCFSLNKGRKRVGH